ncbi:MAG: GNAT family N-acetyltransferase [Exilibacterium sp.]
MRISIRKYQQQDVEPLYRAVIESRKSLRPWMPWYREDYSLSESIAWINYAIEAWNRKKEYAFAVVDTAERVMLGSVRLNHIDTLHRTAKLGYWVKTSCQNRGVATAASVAALKFAFDHLAINRVDIEIAEDNEASRAVAIKLGAIYEGCFRNKLVLQGAPIAAHCYSLIPSDMK